MLWTALFFLGCGSSLPTGPTDPPLHDPVGDWAGDIELPGGAGLPFVVHIVRDEGGSLSGTADSPQQGATGIPISAVATDGDTLFVEIESIGGVFEGTYTDADTLAGEWKQRGMPLPLTLVRGAEIEEPSRPQTPQPPYPYTAEEVVVPTGTHALAGTLTIPEGEGPFPGVVLITGSGPQDRDESLMGHQPFLVLADHLTRSGIAVLRYDDRGIGESTGDFAGATSADFGEDAAAVLAALRARPEVDSGGFIGHSEGGLIAPLIAPTAAPDFMVLLAPPAVPIQELMLAQIAAVGRTSGATQAELDVVMPTQEKLYALAAQGDSPEARAESIALLRALPGGEAANEAALSAQLDGLFSPWMSWFLRYDPTDDLSALSVPVYALWGSRDVQVIASQNAPAFQAATTGNPAAKGQVFEGLNHLFQPATTGAVDEYARIETTIDPAVLAAITEWIRAL